MGDRCSATLRLYGEIKKADLETLASFLDVPESDFVDGEAWTRDFDQVDYGSMDSEFGAEFETWLQENGIRYIWSWDNGAEYTAGVCVFMPGFLATWDTIDGKIAVTTEHFASKDMLDRARSCQAMIDAKAVIVLVDADSLVAAA